MASMHRPALTHELTQADELADALGISVRTLAIAVTLILVVLLGAAELLRDDAPAPQATRPAALVATGGVTVGAPHALAGAVKHARFGIASALVSVRA